MYAKSPLATSIVPLLVNVPGSMSRVAFVALASILPPLLNALG
jgi:hypothetical protein